MRTRTLGNTGVELTTIGLGTWAIGGGGWQFGWGHQEDRESIAAIQRSLELGINWIDTAAVYGLGHSEEIVGQAISGRRDNVFIATKCSRRWTDDGTIYGKLTAESVRKECEDSLRRLSVDVIDLYQIHWPRPEEEIEEGWSTIAELIDEGKVRYGGVSNFDLEQLRMAQSIHPIASLQPPYNMIRRWIEPEILPFCEQNGIGVIAYSPMMSGLLTGKYDADSLADLAEDDWRRNDRHFQEPRFSASVELADRLRPIAERLDLSLAQLAIAWALRRPEVTSAIVGARRPDQIEETALAAEVNLPDDAVGQIEDLLSWHDEAVHSTA